MTEALLETAGLADLEGPAADGRAFTADELRRVVAARNPLAAASLADRARAAASGLEVTWPWTLRVRAPGLVLPPEDGTRVSHALPRGADGDSLDGIAATELEMLGALPADAPLGLALELVRSVAAARPDLPLRALTAGEIASLAARERRSGEDVLRALRSAGLAALSWRTGCGGAAFDAELDIHRAAVACGCAVAVPVGYAKDGLAGFAARAAAAAAIPGIASLVVLPATSETASPLAGTSGIEDWIACAVARLAVGRTARVTADWHVFGWKLGGTLLSAGADDVVAAQCARAWAPPTDDGPRPMSPDRVRAWILEARRSPSVRDGRFRAADFR